MQIQQTPRFSSIYKITPTSEVAHETMKKMLASQNQPFISQLSAFFQALDAEKGIRSLTAPSLITDKFSCNVYGVTSDHTEILLKAISAAVKNKGNKTHQDVLEDVSDEFVRTHEGEMQQLLFSADKGYLAIEQPLDSVH